MMQKLETQEELPQNYHNAMRATGAAPLWPVIRLNAHDLPLFVYLEGSYAEAAPTIMIANKQRPPH